MDNLDIRKKALSQLMGDMDGLEGEGMFPKGGEGDNMAAPAGVDINISVAPKVAEGPDEEDDDEDMPTGDTLESESGDESNRGLPPFLRKAMNKSR